MESTSPEKAGNEYESKLAQARQAQAEVDRAIEELRQVQRFLADAPTIIAARRRAAEQAQQSLSEAESKLEGAREIMSAKQMEVAHLMDKAAGHQQELARSLAPNQHFPEMNTTPSSPSTIPVQSSNQTNTTSKMVASNAAASQTESGGSLTAPAWPTNYAFPSDPSQILKENQTEKQPENEPVEAVVNFLSDRDLPCPSCDFPLRGLKSSKCEKCGMALSLSVLKTNMPPKGTKRIWAIRGVAAIALLMSLYLAMVGFTGRELFACGVGSSCEEVYTSGYAKIRRIPVAVLGVMVFSLIGFASFFVGIGQRDKTRRRGWTSLTLLALLAGGGGLWFIFVQLVMLGGICPHCMVVDVCGLVLAFLILRRAPLMREEELGHSAVGLLNFSKRRTLTLGAIALFSLVGFIGAHTMLKGSGLHRTGDTSQRAGTKPKAKMMMKGLSPSQMAKDSNSNSGNPKSSSTDSSKANRSNRDAVNKKEDKKPSGGGLFFKPAPSVKDKDKK